MAIHPLANDPTVPDVLRRAFARVTHQVLLHMDSGEPVISNAIGYDHAVKQRDESLDLIGNTFRSGRTLVAIEIVAL